MKFSQPRYTTGDVSSRLAELESTEPRPVWAALDAAAAQRFTGEMTLDCQPAVHAWFIDGSAYYAERAGDPAVADRLVGLGVVSREAIARGEVRVGSVCDLSRLFRRVPTLDRDRVEVGLELLTAATLGGSAEHVAASTTVANYRHHTSGVHKWQEAHRHWDDELADALRDALADEISYEEAPAPVRHPQAERDVLADIAEVAEVADLADLVFDEAPAVDLPLQPVRDVVDEITFEDVLVVGLRPHDNALQEWQEQLDQLTAAQAETVEDEPDDDAPIVVLLPAEPESEYHFVDAHEYDDESTTIEPEHTVDAGPDEQYLPEPIVIVAFDPIEVTHESIELAEPELLVADHPEHEPAASHDSVWLPVLPGAPSFSVTTAPPADVPVEEPALALADVIGLVVNEEDSDDDVAVSDDIREAVRAALAEIQAATRPLVTQGVTAADAERPIPAPATAPTELARPEPPVQSAGHAAPPVDALPSSTAPHGSLRRLIGGRGR